MNRNFLTASFESSLDDQKHTFRIVANAGSRMSFAGNDVIIDMGGIFEYKKVPLPIVFSHDLKRVVGIADKQYIENDQLILEGKLLETEDAKLFYKTSLEGLNWEASIGFDILESDEVKDGQEVSVNGRKERGRCIVARRVNIWECSVVLYGADSNTASTITAGMEENKDNDNADILAESTVITGVRKMENENKIDESVSTVNAETEIEKIKAARLAEIQRIDALENVANKYADRSFLATAIEQNWTADKMELETLRASRGAAPAIHCNTDNIDSTAVEVAFIRAAGYEPTNRKYTSDKVLSQADKLAGYDFRELIEAATGYQPTREARRDGAAWLDGVSKFTAGAVTTSTMGSVISSAANAILLEAVRNTNQAWREVFKISSVDDYRISERWRKAAGFTFRKRGRGADFEHGAFSDEKWNVQAESYGIQGRIDEKDLVNGEAMGVFVDHLIDLAEGASQAINDACWNLVKSPSQVDSTDFYSSSFKSLKTSCALSLDNLSAARAEFLAKTWGNSTGTAAKKNAKYNDLIGLNPEIILVPTALEDKALMLTKATTVVNGSTANNPSDYNPQRGRFTVVGVPYLDANSTSSWYLLADPKRLAAFEIVFMRGQQNPIVRTQDVQIGSRGIEFDGALSFGVAQEDYRAILKCTA